MTTQGARAPRETSLERAFEPAYMHLYREGSRSSREGSRPIRDVAPGPMSQGLRACLTRYAPVSALLAALTVACGGPAIEPDPASSEVFQNGTAPADDEAPAPAPARPGFAAEDTDAGAPDPSADPGVSAAALLAKLQTCAKKASSAPYAKDSGGTANIDVCELPGAVFFHADLDVDCDGKQSAVCNKSTDPSYQSQTATTDSTGQYLDAAKLPYIVVPGVSSRWSYKASGVSMGSVGAVIYNGKIEYGIIGDVGPTSIIGEASYAMAKNLGINPDPARGGVSSGVTYVIFTGAANVVKKKEDHAEAVAIGERRAAELIAAK